ncbi:MAG TPA: SIS domain-containing protein [Planosporangium sp.]|nr:SIS domain-containing protein [Planosporangium sp.]
MAPEFIEGVRSQPDVLARSAVTVRDALTGPLGGFAVEVLDRGPIAAIGMGASTHAVTGFAAALRAAGRPAFALSAADLLSDGVPDGLADAYLGVSQSGRSRETVEAMRAVGASAARVALTNNPEYPLGAAADVVLPLGCGEDTRVSTLSYTATVQALGLLVDALTGFVSTDWDGLPGLVESVLAADVAPVVDAFADVSVIDVVGCGIRSASVGAAALLLREAVHVPTAGFTTREYLHGPLEVVGEGRGALVFGEPGGREAQLAGELAGWGASVVLVTSDADVPAHPNLRVVRLPMVGGLGSVVLDILPVQVAAAGLAERKGLAIGLHHMPDDTKLGPA